jgi:alkaline phosphatase D
LRTAASTALFTVGGGIAKPSISRVADRPVVTHGLQSGDVSVDSAVVGRADRPRACWSKPLPPTASDRRSAVQVDALAEWTSP